MSPWSGWAIPRRVLLVSAAVALALTLVFFGVRTLAGIPAAVALGMGFLAGTRPAIALPPRSAVALSVPIALAGGVAVALREQPFPAAAFVALCCLMIAPAEIRQQGLLPGLPTAAAVLVAVPGNFGPATTAAWMFVGSMLLVAIAVITKLPRKVAVGTAPVQAWRHTAVMAVTVGAVVYVVQLYEVPHGYWVAVTLTVVLRPLPAVAWKREQRIVGTVGGVVLAMALSFVIPAWALALVLVTCVMLMLAYAMRDDYARQVLFLTPAVVLLAPAGGVGTAATERALATLVGTLLAGAVALALERIGSADT